MCYTIVAFYGRIINYHDFSEDAAQEVVVQHNEKRYVGTLAMREVLRKHHISFTSAVSGIQWAVRTQPNFRVHLVLSASALIGGWFFDLTSLEMLILIFTIVLGLSAEMVNTAIESMTDLITLEWRQEAKIAKDVSAGMMLITAAGALVVAAAIFIPRIVG